MTQIICKCGVELYAHPSDIQALEYHANECPAAFKEGPPYHGPETRWWIEQDPGVVIALHAVYAVEFESPKDGPYIKLYDEGKTFPKKLLRGRIVYVGQERRQVLRGMNQVTFAEGWQGEAVKK